MRTVATATDLERCPRCDSEGLYHAAGLSRRTGQSYEYWLCNNLGVPCQEIRNGETRVLSWKSTRQWAFLHDTQPSPPRG